MSLREFLNQIISDNPIEDTYNFRTEPVKNTIIKNDDHMRCSICDYRTNFNKIEEYTYSCDRCGFIVTLHDSQTFADQEISYAPKKKKPYYDNNKRSSNKIEIFLDVISKEFKQISNHRLEINAEVKRIFELIVSKKIKRSTCRISLIAIIFIKVCLAYSIELKLDHVCRIFMISRHYLSQEMKLLDLYEERNIFSYTQNNMIDELKKKYPMRRPENHNEEILIKVETLRNTFNQSDDWNLFIFVYKLVLLIIKNQFFIRTSHDTKALAILVLVKRYTRQQLREYGIESTAYKNVVKVMREQFLPLYAHSPVQLKKIKRIRRLFKIFGYISALDNRDL
jgi:hypothetical protein